MNISYNRLKAITGKKSPTVDFNEAYAIQEMFKFIFEDFVLQDNQKDYDEIPEYLENTFIAADRPKEFIDILKGAIKKIKSTELEKLEIQNLNPKGEEIVKVLKEIYPNLELKELKGAVRQRILEEPQDIEVSISDAKNKLNQNEFNKYRKLLENYIIFDSKKVSKNENEIQIVIDETDANLEKFDISENEDEINFDGIKAIQALSESEVSSKTEKIFSLGFNSAKLQDREGYRTQETGTETINIADLGESYFKLSPKEKQEIKDGLDIYQTYLAYVRKQTILNNLLALLVPIVKYRQLFDRVEKELKTGNIDITLKIEEGLKDVINEGDIDYFTELLNSVISTYEPLEEFKKTFNELYSNVKDSEKKETLKDLARSLEEMVATTKKYLLPKYKDGKTLKKIKDMITDLKSIVYSSELDFLEQFEIRKKMTVAQGDKDYKLQSKKAYTLAFIFRNPEMFDVKLRKQKIEELKKEIKKNEKEIKQLQKENNASGSVKENQLEEFAWGKNILALQKRIEGDEKIINDLEKKHLGKLFQKLGYIGKDGQWTQKFLNEVSEAFGEKLDRLVDEFYDAVEEAKPFLVEQKFGGLIQGEDMTREQLISLMQDNLMQDPKKTASFKKEIIKIRDKFKENVKEMEKNIDEFIKGDTLRKIGLSKYGPEILVGQEQTKNFLSQENAKKYYFAGKKENAAEIMKLINKSDSPFRSALKQINLLHRITITVKEKIGEENTNYSFKTYKIENLKEFQTSLISTGKGSEEAFKPLTRKKIGFTKFKTARKGDYAMFMDSLFAGIEDLEDTIREMV